MVERPIHITRFASAVFDSRSWSSRALSGHSCPGASGGGGGGGAWVGVWLRLLLRRINSRVGCSLFFCSFHLEDLSKVRPPFCVYSKRKWRNVRLAVDILDQLGIINVCSQHAKASKRSLKTR
jgi:hypothetical protein